MIPTRAIDEFDIREQEGRTDTANAMRFAERYHDTVRYCDPWQKWLVWDGRRWAMDQERRIEALAKTVAKGLWQDVATLGPLAGDDALKAMTRFAKSSSGAAGINNMLALARSESGIPVLPDRLDTDPWLFNVANGTIDLKTGKLRRHDIDDSITKLSKVQYDPKADCPTWREFLDRIMAGNAELIAYLRRLVGYCLTGCTTEHVLLLLYGTGANGKSVFLNTVQALQGRDYAIKAAPDLLLAKKGAHPTELADLHGKRFVACIESDDGRRLAESLVKELTGGDSIRARRMREDFWEFAPTHKIWLATNHKPTVRGTDHGIWRRVKLIPFTVTIPDDEQDKELPNKLLAELPGILNWALLGCNDWQAQGLSEPAVVQSATNEYQAEMDVLAAFITDCCVTGDNFKTGATQLYTAYRKWCETAGEDCVNQRRFGLQLSERGFGTDKVGKVFRTGIGLRAEEG